MSERLTPNEVLDRLERLRNAMKRREAEAERDLKETEGLLERLRPLLDPNDAIHYVLMGPSYAPRLWALGRFGDRIMAELLEVRDAFTLTFPQPSDAPDDGDAAARAADAFERTLVDPSEPTAKPEACGYGDGLGFPGVAVIDDEAH